MNHLKRILIILLFLFVFPGQSQAQISSSFFDTFTGNDGTEISNHDAHWLLDTGRVQIQNNTLFFAEASYLSLPTNSIIDQCTSYDFLFPTLGIVLIDVRKQEDGSAYSAHINKPGNIADFGLTYLLNGGQTYFVNKENISLSSGWHTFKLCTIGSTITASIDNEVIGSAENSDLTQGYITIAASEGNYFDNFRFESKDLSVSITPTPSLSPSISLTPTITSSPTRIPTPKVGGLPKVFLLWPKNKTKVGVNKSITLFALATSKQKIKKVSFFINNELICTDTTLFYTCNWKVPKQVGKNYTIIIKAYDKLGRIGESKSIHVTAK